MNTMKKFILTIIFITMMLILCMSTKVFADTKTIELGQTIDLSEKDMSNADNVYCVAHGKYFYNTCTFKATAYVDIEGKDATGVKLSINGNEETTETITINGKNENAVISAILGGILQKGYGSYQHYNPAQQALYGYWNKWVKNVGTNYGFQSDEANTKIFEEANQDTQKYINDAISSVSTKTYKVRIYLLHSNSDTNPQELILVDVKNPTEPNEPGPSTPTIVTGYVNISGYVWEDIANGKSNTINSKYENEDLRLEGIKVHWKASDGTEIASTTTDKDGSYKLQTTLELYNHPYGIKDKDKYDKINNSYVEFEYNGLKYTTVAYNGNLSNSDTSKGKEIETLRENLDNKFDEVKNKAVYDGNIQTLSNLPNTQKALSNYTSEFAVSASTQNIARLLLDTAKTNGWTNKKTFCTDHCQAGEGPHIVYNETYEDSYIKMYCNGQLEINDPHGHWTDEEKLSKIEILGNDINTATGSQSHYYSADETNGPTHRDCRSSSEEIYEWNINNVNLGLIKREQPDAAITSDIEKVRVIMKNQEYTYIYGNRGIQSNDELFDYKVKFGSKYMETYSRPINPADIAYVSYNNTDDLKVYVTYNIIATNQSNTLTMTINNVVNYYDSNYTIYTGQGSSTSLGWQESQETNNGYKVAYNNILKETKIAPQTKSEILKIEFEVNQDRIKGLLNENATLYNFSEIISYTTYYGEKTICAETEQASAKGKTNKQYSGIDYDSTPGNTIPGNIDTYEDDTDKAPSFLLMKDPNYKTMTGIVYEDTQTQESKKDNERLGNGQKDGNEKGVENVKVELLNAETKEIAYIYYKDATTESGANRKPAITYTDANGNYTFGEPENCGIIVDDYIIKYTYGNADKGVDGNGTTIGETKINGSIINARNYKSTIITDSVIKSIMQGNKSDNWYLNMNTDIDTTIAVDDLQQRLEQETLKYGNYNEPVNMSAYSKTFKVQIENTKQKEVKVDNNGGSFQHDWAVFDFGIIERARENIIIDKTISKIKLTLANGQVLLEGDPRTDKMNYVKALGFNNRKVSEYSPLDKALTIEIDKEIIQGAKIEVWYSITVTNKGEKDYDYEENSNYYYYGTDRTTVMGIADLVVDYMNSSIDCQVGNDFTQNDTTVNNKDWYRYDNETATDAEYLKDNGYISYKKDEEQELTYETIKNRELQSIMTDTFSGVLPGETKTSVIYASKALGTQEDNTILENHVEIVKLNGKTGRTIKAVKDDDRTQIAKEYQPGNYIPTLSGEHQQDDDRVRIVITPPTGTTNYITIYIIASIVAMIVIAGGIVLIKKKLIKK